MTDEPTGELRPFVSVRHRRRAGAFAAGFVCGAATAWIVVLVATVLGR